eukprot:gene14302-19183_t
MTDKKTGKITYDYNPPKFNVGDFVHYKLDEPLNALGQKQNTKKFREGDYRLSKEALKIKEILYFNTPPYYRYLLEGRPNVSYCDEQLKKSNTTHEMRVPSKIVGKMKKNGETYYKIRWKNLKKKDDTYESKTNLIEDGLKDFFIDDYEENL